MTDTHSVLVRKRSVMADLTCSCGDWSAQVAADGRSIRDAAEMHWQDVRAHRAETDPTRRSPK